MNEYLLLDGTQIPVLSELAQVVGLNEAIVLQEVYYWCKVNKREKRPTHDGFYWVYNSYREWRESHFPWWSVDTVRKTFANLEKEGLLVSGNFNKSKMDRTKWYRIDFTTLSRKISSSPLVKNALMDMGGITKPIQTLYQKEMKMVRFRRKRQKALVLFPIKTIHVMWICSLLLNGTIRFMPSCWGLSIQKSDRAKNNMLSKNYQAF